jgi:hypothetical protein
MLKMVLSLFIFLLPGFLLSSIIFSRPKRVDLMERLAISVCLGLASTSLKALVLVFFKAFSGSTLGIFLAVEIAVLVAVSLKRRVAFLEILLQAAKELSPKNTRMWVPLLAISGLTLLFSATITSNVSLGPPCLYYMSQAKLISETGTTSGKLFEWGKWRDVLWGKVLFNLFTASFISISKAGYIAIMKFLPIMYLFTAMLCSYLFYRQLFDIPYALSGIFVTFANPFFARFFISKFLAFRGEAFAIMFLFFFFYCFLKSFFEKEKIFTSLSVATLIVMAAWHGVVFLIALMVFVAFYPAKCLLELKISWPDIKALFKTLVVVAVGVSVVLSMAGVGHFHRRAAGSITKEERLNLYKGLYDPTWEYIAKLQGYEHRKVASGRSFYRPPEKIYREMLELATPFSPKKLRKKNFPLIVTFILVLLIAYLLFRVDKRKRIVLLAFVIFSLGLAAMIFFFSFHYDTYIPAEHPMRREIKYISLISIMIVLMFFNDCLKYKKVHVPAVIVSLIACGYLSYATVSDIDRFKQRHYQDGTYVSHEGQELFTWMEDNLRKEPVVLSNIRTTSLYLLSGRKGLIEGRSSYIESDLLGDALAIMDDVKDFYQRPSLKILKKYDVGYVIFAPQGGLGGNNIIHTPVDKKRLGSAEFLRKIKSFGTIELYEVRG